MLSILKSKVFWYVIIAIILLIIILKYKNIVLDKIKSQVTGDFGNTITAGRKLVLESWANILNTEIYDTFGNASDMLEQIAIINDDEFRYFVKYYNRQFSNSLYEDIDNEILYYTDADEIIMTRLKQQGF